MSSRARRAAVLALIVEFFWVSPGSLNLCHAEVRLFELTRVAAEAEALKTSNQLKSYGSNFDAAIEQADAQFSYLLPRFTFDATYRYVANVPTLNIQGFPPFPFGANNNYSIGPSMSYILWDTFGTRNAYRSLSKLADSRKEDWRTAELQLLLNVRAAYIRVQLAIEELKLTRDSLSLSRAQNHDITVNFNGGAASRLDLVESQRAMLNYELQFKQRQADLSASLEDLLALIDQRVDDISHPGPPGVEDVTLELKLDPLEKSFYEMQRWQLSPPDENQPQIHSQELLAESADLSARSVKSALYPSLQLAARADLEYPNGPIIEQIKQGTVTVSLTMPLFEADHTRHLTREKLREADSARYRMEQAKVDLGRDFSKAKEMLGSLLEQRQVALDDVQKSEEAARLNYASYKAGKINLTDVLNANVRALQARVEAAGIDAQILNQLIIMKAVSGGESANGK